MPSTFLTPPSLATPRRISRTTCCATSPLDAAHVLLTAPAPYAARLAPLFISAHARPIWAPAITTTALTDASEIAALHASLLALPSYAVLAFTSRTGLRQVGDHLRALADGDAELAATLLRGSGTRIAALGRDATAAAEALGVTADIVPLSASPSGLAEFLAADELLGGASVLCPVPVVRGMKEPPVVPQFLADLKGRGFQVTAVPAYVTRPVARELLRVEIAMLERGEVDAVAFSSAGEAYALAGVLSEAERHAFLRRVGEGKVLVAAHGPFTAAGIRDALGVEDVLVSEDFSSFDGLVQVLETAFSDRQRKAETLIVPS